MGAVPKPFLPLAGRPMLTHALRALLEVPEVHEAVVVAPPEYLDAARACTAAFPRIAAVVPGGEERQDSVAAGLEAVPRAEWVVVHDAARPLVSPELVRRVLAAAAETGAATAAIPSRDTLKEVAGGVVTRTLDRERIWQVQTPQAFRAALLRAAHARAREEGLRATDDAGLVEAAGGVVRVVEGEALNLKVTTPEDLEVAEAVVAQREGRGAVRTGIGYDAHRLVPGRRLVLGGVTIPFDRGLAGHSDADAVLHALMDALLGAAGLPDIGHHFPAQERFRGADSRRLLAEVVSRVRAAGFLPAQVDVVVLAEEPRLAPHLPEMRRVMAELLGVEEGAVGIKATTTDGLGAIGRGEGIAAQAVATLRPLKAGREP
jgi:2-C-methyl-D-erythritol 4-phosphate cytidylyltransferase/2-C-methyl-D-erythritol 2,4-cyclodiphosphate synthase